MSGMLVKEWSKGKGRGGGKTVLFLWRSPYELVLAPGRNPEKAFWRLCKRCCTAEKEGGREGGGGEEGENTTVYKQPRSSREPDQSQTGDRIMESKVGNQSDKTIVNLHWYLSLFADFVSPGGVRSGRGRLRLPPAGRPAQGGRVRLHVTQR